MSDRTNEETLTHRGQPYTIWQVGDHWDSSETVNLAHRREAIIAAAEESIDDDLDWEDEEEDSADDYFDEDDDDFDDDWDEDDDDFDDED